MKLIYYVTIVCFFPQIPQVIKAKVFYVLVKEVSAFTSPETGLEIIYEPL